MVIRSLRWLWRRLRPASPRWIHLLLLLLLRLLPVMVLVMVAMLQVGSNGAVLICHLKKEAATSEGLRGAPAAAATDGAVTGANAAYSAVSSCKPISFDGAIGATAAAVDSSGGGGGGGRCLHPVAFSVLADAFDSIVNVAVQQQDFAILAAALELSMKLYTSAGFGSSVRLLHALSSNPYLYTRFVWGGLLSLQLRTVT
ncbi:hypothetical protein Vretimale_9705, partial [Volvox reticuliferus]